MGQSGVEAPHRGCIQPLLSFLFPISACYRLKSGYNIQQFRGDGCLARFVKAHI